jgi:hypothetical protein
MIYNLLAYAKFKGGYAAIGHGGTTYMTTMELLGCKEILFIEKSGQEIYNELVSDFG